MSPPDSLKCSGGFRMGNSFFLFTFTINFRVSIKIGQGLSIRVFGNWVINTRGERQWVEVAMSLKSPFEIHDLIFILRHKKVSDISYN